MLTVITATYSLEPEPARDRKMQPKRKKIVKRDVSSVEDAGRTLVIVYASSNRALPDGNS